MLTRQHCLEHVHDEVSKGVLQTLQKVVSLPWSAENFADLLHHFYCPVHAVQVLLTDLVDMGNIRNTPFLVGTKPQKARLNLRIVLTLMHGCSHGLENEGLLSGHRGCCGWHASGGTAPLSASGTSPQGQALQWLHRDQRVKEFPSLCQDLLLVHRNRWGNSFQVWESKSGGKETKGLSMLCSGALTKARNAMSLANSATRPFTALVAMNVKQMLFPLRTSSRALFSMSHSLGTTAGTRESYSQL